MLKVLNIICIVLIIVMLLFLLESIREHNKFCIKEYSIISDKVPYEFQGTRLAVLADLHNALYGKDNKQLLQKIMQEKPDYIMLAGDMIVCKSHTERRIRQTAKLIQDLSTIAPVYYGFGNHEYGVREQLHNTKGLWDSYIKALDLSKHPNILFLDNKRIIIKRNSDQICIAGLTLDRSYFKRFCCKRLDKDIVKKICLEDNTYNILLAHNPDYFTTYEEAGADLILSGHNHGGMIRIPVLGGVISPRFHLFPKFDRGRYEKGNSTMILSGGLGTHSIPVRVNNMPELLFVQLHNSTK